MKAASAGLNTHLQGEVTTLTTCWLLMRTDGTAFHFTAHDVDLPIDIADGKGEQTYQANSSYNRSAIKNDDTLSVDNLDLTGVLESGLITENELRNGLFDFAEVRIFLVNYADLTQGILRMRKGWLGEVTITPNGFFLAELRGLTQAFSRNVGEKYSPECRADLGDVRCVIPIFPEVAVRNKAYAVGDFVRASSDLEAVSVATMLVPGSNGAEDLGTYGGTPTLGSQAAVQSVVTKFGPSAIEFTPSGSVDPSLSFVSYPDDPALTIGSNAFTVETWIRFKDLTSTDQTWCAHFDSSGNQISWRFARRTGNISVFLSDDGSSGAPATFVEGAFTPGWAIDTWYHVVVTRDASDDLRLFVDGVQYGATTNISFAFHNSTAPLWLGKTRRTGFDDFPFDGFMEDFRFTVGVALYTANFTPPIAAHQSIADAIAALVCVDFDDRIYVVTTAGTSDATVQPAYDTTVGNPTTDGSVILDAEQAWSRCIDVTAVDGTDPRKKFTITELLPVSGGGTDGRDQFPDDSMNGGVVVWETGNNTGKAMEVRDFASGDPNQVLELFLDLPFDVEIGDTGRVYRGCLKRLIADCKDIFDNVDNFRGEPYLPGQDLLFDYPDAKA